MLNRKLTITEAAIDTLCCLSGNYLELMVRATGDYLWGKKSTDEIYEQFLSCCEMNMEGNNEGIPLFLLWEKVVLAGLEWQE